MKPQSSSKWKLTDFSHWFFIHTLPLKKGLTVTSISILEISLILFCWLYLCLSNFMIHFVIILEMRARENAIHWISNDSLAEISHNYPYTANTVDLNIMKAKGWALAMFVWGVMPLDGSSCLLIQMIQMFLSGESEETAEIKARTRTTTSNFLECKGNT